MVEALRKDAKTEYEREILDRYEEREDEISQMKAELDVTQGQYAKIDLSLQSNANKKAVENGGKVQNSISRTKSMSWESQIKGLFLKNGAIKK